MTPKQSQSGNADPADLFGGTWTFQDLYDAIMAEIEPDLVSTETSGLDEKYKGESKEDRTVRLERYKKAAVLCMERFQELMFRWKKEVTNVRKKATKLCKQKSRKKEMKQLEDIDRSLDAQ